MFHRTILFSCRTVRIVPQWTQLHYSYRRLILWHSVVTVTIWKAPIFLTINPFITNIYLKKKKYWIQANIFKLYFFSLLLLLPNPLLHLLLHPNPINIVVVIDVAVSITITVWFLLTDKETKNFFLILDQNTTSL